MKIDIGQHMKKVGFDADKAKVTILGSKRDYYSFDIPTSKFSYKSEPILQILYEV